MGEILWILVYHVSNLIFYIEPGALLLAKNARSEGFSSMLISYLSGVIDSFEPNLGFRTLWHVRVSMRRVLELGVFQSFIPLRESFKRLPEPANSQFKQIFKMFIDTDGLPSLESLKQLSETNASESSIGLHKPKKDLRILLAEYGLSIENEDLSRVASLSKAWIGSFIDLVKLTLTSPLDCKY